MMRPDKSSLTLILLATVLCVQVGIFWRMTRTTICPECPVCQSVAGGNMPVPVPSQPVAGGSMRLPVPDPIQPVAEGKQHEKCRKAMKKKLDVSAKLVRTNSMTSLARKNNVVDAAIDVTVHGLEGDWIETGTWKGGVSLLAAEAFRAAYEAPECPTIQRTVWLADSFEGLPPEREIDKGKSKGGSKMDPPGSYGGYKGVETVKSTFKADGFDVEGNFVRGVRVRFLKGWFNETIPLAPIGKLAILRLDGDMYSSTMDTIVPLYPKLVTSGHLIIDDYGHWIQCRRAIDDYFASLGFKPDLKRIDYTGRFMIKPP